MKQNMNLNSWDEFDDSEYLKASRVKDKDHGFAVIDVGVISDEDGTHPKVMLTLSTDEGKLVKKFALNATNRKFLEALQIGGPKDLIGRVVYFKKVEATNPQTKQIVDALRIWKCEKVD